MNYSCLFCPCVACVLQGRRVTAENLPEYIQKLAAKRLGTNIEKETAEIRAGFDCVLGLRAADRQALQAWCESNRLADAPFKLGKMICGEARFDVAGWKACTTVHNTAGDGCKTPELFWAYLEGLRPDQRAELFHWFTGVRSLPVGGFNALPMPLKLTIATGTTADHLPQAHTCTCELELPPYETAGALAQKMNQAVFEGGGFHVQ